MWNKKKSCIIFHIIIKCDKILSRNNNWYPEMYIPITCARHLSPKNICSIYDFFLLPGCRLKFKKKKAKKKRKTNERTNDRRKVRMLNSSYFSSVWFARVHWLFHRIALHTEQYNNMMCAHTMCSAIPAKEQWTPTYTQHGISTKPEYVVLHVMMITMCREEKFRSCNEDGGFSRPTKCPRKHTES